MPSITLDEAIRRQNRTAVQIAGAVGLHPSFLSQIRRGRRRAPPEVRPLLERELNASLDFDAPPPAAGSGTGPAPRPHHPPKSLEDTADDLVAGFERLAPLLRKGAAGIGAGALVTSIARGAGLNRHLSLALGLAAAVLAATQVADGEDGPEVPASPETGATGPDLLSGPSGSGYADPDQDDPDRA